MTEQFNIIAEQEHSTVMAHNDALPWEDKGYQSETALEEAFIHQLTQQGYERVDISSVKQLIENLRAQICRLNDLTLTRRNLRVASCRRRLPIIS